MAATALVTGAARRVGAAIVRALHAAGANVVIHCHRSARCRTALAAELEGVRAGSTAVVQCRSARHAPRCRALIDAALARFGALHVLVNNASSFYATPLGDDHVRPHGMICSAPICARRCSWRRPPRRSCDAARAADQYRRHPWAAPAARLCGLLRRQGRADHAHARARARARPRRCASTRSRRGRCCGPRPASMPALQSKITAADTAAALRLARGHRRARCCSSRRGAVCDRPDARGRRRPQHRLVARGYRQTAFKSQLDRLERVLGASESAATARRASVPRADSGAAGRARPADRACRRAAQIRPRQPCSRGPSLDPIVIQQQIQIHARAGPSAALERGTAARQLDLAQRCQQRRHAAARWRMPPPRLMKSAPSKPTARLR